MSEGGLQQGISILYDMEANNYQMTVAISRLNRGIARLGEANKFYKPRLKENTVHVSDYAISMGIGGAILGAIIGLIVGFVVGNGFFNTVNKIFEYVIKIGLSGGIAGTIIGVVLGSTAFNHEDERLNNEFQKSQKVYEKNVAGDKRRVQAELRLQKELISQRDLLETRLYDAQDTLDDFYDTIGIDQNYRNIIPIGYMYDYIRLGIATKLEGTDGLNYLIRQELRQDQMQYTLNEILQKLDAIIDNQSNLYGELQQIRKSGEALVQMTVESVKIAAQNKQKLAEISEQTSIVAYNSERIKKELEFQTFMAAYRGT